jgi:hypothetical protein
MLLTKLLYLNTVVTDERVVSCLRRRLNFDIFGKKREALTKPRKNTRTEGFG